MNNVSLKIPATSANLGLGFDTMGLAVNKYLYIKATESDKWEFEFLDEELRDLPNGVANFVASTAICIAKTYNKVMPDLFIEMSSEIPLTHGLGSSSSAIVAGIELANHYCQLGLSMYDKILLASKIEGHPDNVGPCITGGAFVGYYRDGYLAYHQLNLDKISLILSIPPYEISTKVAREAIPDTYEKGVAIEQNALNNVMLLSMVNKDYKTMGELMMQDKFHEPYRQPLIAEFPEIKEIAVKNGAYATVISGAGPTVLTLCPEDKVEGILKELQQVSTCKHESVEVHYN
ncbi:homoserine kinase [Aerococcaceae bacterium INB8]|uniref:Homoserine kinase n=1 Tax=Ruoffia halotolerans TaxID=2748684 RepID=A0A839A607_9LACT|nr:homoserine kinase [Ruoffia halotolerans]MBA5729442.1 homoserine kinase [Ruoffia halotolerans]